MKTNRTIIHKADLLLKVFRMWMLSNITTFNFHLYFKRKYLRGFCYALLNSSFIFSYINMSWGLVQSSLCVWDSKKVNLHCHNTPLSQHPTPASTLYFSSTGGLVVDIRGKVSLTFLLIVSVSMVIKSE